MSTSMKLLLAAGLLWACLIMPAQTLAHGHRGPDCCPAPPPPPPQHIVLVVCHPCCDCPLQVPVCIPACCQGPPSVCHQRSLFGCGKTVFTWSCGYQVVIRFTRHGGYRVVRS